jgi:membrane protein DedA with SNARE-associated domain
MSIGITRYSGKKFAFINLLSAWCWASLTIVPAYLLGEHIWNVIKIAQKHWYFAIPVAIAVAIIIISIFRKIEDNLYKQKLRKKNANQNNK